jgi:hypothetical protein
MAWCSGPLQRYDALTASRNRGVGAQAPKVDLRFAQKTEVESP